MTHIVNSSFESGLAVTNAAFLNESALAMIGSYAFRSTSISQLTIPTSIRPFDHTVFGQLSFECVQFENEKERINDSLLFFLALFRFSHAVLI
jgi:hypothetical protein